MNASNGLLTGGSAAALGLGLGGGGVNAKLSRERKHRMREHATQKLSQAYHLDEIAASVATMQSASALEDVAQLVLQRNQNDPDAKYVHFFHEKIPSRALAECTSLQPLDEIIRDRPTEGAPYRTRAVTKIFKEDYLGATRDLTEALGACRLYNMQHKEKNLQTDMILAREAFREYRVEAKVDERDHPNSLEPQLLFHRAGTYLTLACDQIAPALFGLKVGKLAAANGIISDATSVAATLATAGQGASQAHLEARKLVRTYAKRALRDYTSFLSHFDYTPGLPSEITEAFFQKVSAAANGYGKRYHGDKLLDMPNQQINGKSGALVRRNGCDKDLPQNDVPALPSTVVHSLNTLFAAVPPSDLPPYPAESTTLVLKNQLSYQAMQAPSDISEAISYHPLLTDALHSLLLCHCLIQTSPKEHLRHAYMVARLARVCDGYPIFLAARSPARADWIEVLRRAQNWLGLGAAWETLCAPAPLPSQNETRSETAEQKKDRLKREAVREALADDRVHDEESFKASVRARELRAAREEEEEQRIEYLRAKTRQARPNGGTCNGTSSDGPPKWWAQEDGKEYPISTDRADAIARWIREAPAPGSNSEGKAKKGAKNLGRRRKQTSDLSSVNRGFERSVESLGFNE